MHSASPLKRFCSSSFAAIARKVSGEPTMHTQRLARVTAVYMRLRFIRSLGPVSRGMTTAGYSLPCALCTVTA